MAGLAGWAVPAHAAPDDNASVGVAAPVAPATATASPVKVLVPKPDATNRDDPEMSRMVQVVQSSLRNELSSAQTPAGAVSVSTLEERFDSREDRLKAARSAGGTHVVECFVQSVGGSVRISGQVLDANTGRVIAPLQATGPATEFFGVQDEFVRQARSAIASSPGSLPSGNLPTPSSLPSGVMAAPGTASVIPPTSGSYWSGFTPVETVQSPMMYPPPTPPPPPLYGGYRAPYFGGGGYFENYPGYYVPNGPLGVTRVEQYGKLGTSIIPPPPGLSRGGYTVPSNHYRASQGPTPIPAHAQSIRQYKNPNARFAAPVGQPQRAAPPNLRPGT